MPIDSELVDYLRKNGYHPRSSRPSDFQSGIIIRDLVAACPLLNKRAAAGEVVAKLRHHQQVGHADWVIDIAIGTSPRGSTTTHVSAGGVPSISMGTPVIIQIAIELKAIFTEHGKARRNRLRDFNAFHSYAREYDPQTVSGAFLVVNSAERFYSQLRAPTDITTHANSKVSAGVVAANAVDIFRSIHLRNSSSELGLDALGVVVVEHDNLAIHPDPAVQITSRQTRVAPAPPSPAVGDPLHYESMIQRLCRAYTARFGAVAH